MMAVMMAIDRIPPGRRVAVIAAHKLARDAFDAAEPRIQNQLTPLFLGVQVGALHAIERLASVQHAGEFGTEDPEKAVAELGALAIACAAVCEVNALHIRPICDLARVYTKHEGTAHVHVMVAAGLLAAVVREGCDRLRLTDAIGLILAKAIDEVEIVHELRVDLPGVYETIARELFAGHVVKAAALETHGLLERDADITPAAKSRALVALQGGIDNLAAAEVAEGPGDFDVSDTMHAMITDKLCPQCGGLLSPCGASDVWRCSNGHDITEMQLAAAKR